MAASPVTGFSKKSPAFDIRLRFRNGSSDAALAQR
jgi:hypothetical protein